jgi:hypothetical protein
MAYQSEVDEYRNDYRHKIHPFHGMMRVHDPGIDDGGERQENEAEDDDQERVVRSLQEIR